ncbi:MAG: ribose-phosphate diphosphokinase [Candidatus Hodarchaeales archaeon]|jgi:ribose-phosphate pyrophosphokinase
MKVIVVGKHDFAGKLSTEIEGAIFIEIDERIFPDGEVCPRLLLDNQNPIENSHVIIAMQLGLDQPINQYLVSLLLTIYNVKRHGATKVTCIMPYHIYSRQDRETRLGEPFSSKYLASMLETAGMDEYVTINSHSYGKNPLSDFFSESRSISLSAIPLIARAVKMTSNSSEDILCFSPDEGALMLAKEAAEAIDSPFYGAIRKRRDPKTGKISQEMIGIDISLENRHILIVDDLVSSGGTMVGAARIFKQQGAKEVYLGYIHGVHTVEKFEKLKKEDIQIFVTTNSIKQEIPGLTTVSVVKLIADWINSNLS